MNKQILKKLNRLCGELENLQNRLQSRAEPCRHTKMVNSTEAQRETYERVSKAKREMIDAIRIYEQS